MYHLEIFPSKKLSETSPFKKKSYQSFTVLLNRPYDLFLNVYMSTSCTHFPMYIISQGTVEREQ